MKVILDFPNLREDPSLSKHMDTMIAMAKEAKGFLFFIDRGDSTGMQQYMLNDLSLATMISKLEEGNPGVKQIKMMSEMMEALRGGD